MSFLDSLLHWLAAGGHREANAEDLAREEAFRERLRDRCQRFRRLLSANKAALEAMSEVEEHLAGAHPFGMPYVRGVSIRAASAVFRMARNLNALSDNAHAPVLEAFHRVSGQMQALLQRREQPEGPLVLPLSAIGLADASLVGGKMANLGEVAAHVGLDVPDGFAVTVCAYERFMEHKGLRDELERRIQTTDMESLDAVFELAATLQQAVLSAPLPPELECAITDAVASLRASSGEHLLLALRSSAVGEDGPGVSFAGQYRSELNVPPEEVCHVWKEIVASKYAVTAMSYRFQHGIADEDAPMCVGVLAMVPSSAGGVAYSRDPVAASRGHAQILINAVPGLAQGVVDGALTPDTYLFTHDNPPRPLSSAPGTPRTDPCLTAAQAGVLARMALALEEYYNEPQDVEWALNARTGRIAVLQSRPLRSAAVEPDTSRSSCDGPEYDGTAAEDAAPPQDGGLTPLAQGGVAVSPGVGMGPVFVARREADMLSFPQGGILVVERAMPRWGPLLSRAAGMISETGGMAGHLASVAREYRLPAVFSLAGACTRLQKAREVTLDASRCAVYAVRQPQLAARARIAPPNLMVGSPVFRRLAALSQLMVPLNLLDPAAPDFSPTHCRTLHDITRFCHEKSVELMFETDPLSQRMGKQLKAGAKLQYWIIDMGGGFAHHIPGPVVDIAEIASAPMLALWDGMVAVPWAGPPAASASGFMAVMLESTMNPDLESTAPNVMATKNFFIISDTYMVLQARYGYHFCTVETLAGANNHENFVNFQFKGGAADRVRRQLRVRMVADLLETHGFRADVKGDSLFAVAEDFPAGDILRKTRLIGYLLIHTRQVDMIMLDTERASALGAKLAADMAALEARALPAKCL